MDIGGLGRTLADSDGHWRTQTDSCCKGESCLPRSHITKGSPKSCAKKSHNVYPPMYMSAYVLSFYGFFETTDVIFGSLADIDGH